MNNDLFEPLNSKITSSEISLTPSDNHRLMNLCGRFDEHLRQIEKRLHVEINNRGHIFQIIGEENTVKLASNFIKTLYEQTKSNHELTPHHIHLLLQQLQQKLPETLSVTTTGSQNAPKQEKPQTLIKIKSGTFRAQSKNQENYIKSILSCDINFGVGPAGTGKTYLAVACAVQALEQDQVKRILLVRPAVEAGERLGFLPGDLAQKIDPYLRPLYDALYEMLGLERTLKLVERNVIELAPLAYMRGRTLNDSFIILDEGQNTTPEQMKMFLTRIGFGSTAVITGDITQVDLPHGHYSGLRHVINVLRETDGISFTFFDSRDVVRHPLVQKIIEAYEKFEDTHPTKNKR